MQTLTSSDLQTSSCQDLPCPREASPSTSKASSQEAPHVVVSVTEVAVVASPPAVAEDSVTEAAVAASLPVVVVASATVEVAVVAEVHPEADSEQTEMHDAYCTLLRAHSTNKQLSCFRTQFNSTLLQTLAMICDLLSS